MCLVSAIGDNFKDQWPKNPNNPWGLGPNQTGPFTSVNQAEFNALKKVVEGLRHELDAAKKQDIAEGNPDCEMEDKVAFIKKLAEFVGVDLGGIFK